jgi:hypothetical protein
MGPIGGELSGRVEQAGGGIAESPCWRQITRETDW